MLELQAYTIWITSLHTSAGVIQAPMMVSAVACIIGNIAYCLSYDAKSLALLVIARLITGFGKALATWSHAKTSKAATCDPAEPAPRV